MGHQRGFLPILIPVAVTFNAMAGQIALKPIDQRQIAVPADRGKSHQPFQHLTWRQFFHADPLYLGAKVALPLVPVNPWHFAGPTAQIGAPCGQIGTKKQG
jgi:hypothetical protein